jgi:hypothetical protein
MPPCNNIPRPKAASNRSVEVGLHVAQLEMQPLQQVATGHGAGESALDLHPGAAQEAAGAATSGTVALGALQHGGLVATGQLADAEKGGHQEQHYALGRWHSLHMPMHCVVCNGNCTEATDIWNAGLRLQMPAKKLLPQSAPKCRHLNQTLMSPWQRNCCRQVAQRWHSMFYRVVLPGMCCRRCACLCVTLESNEVHAVAKITSHCRVDSAEHER